MRQYHIEDFPGYEQLFRKHSTAVVELMRILEEKIKADLEIATYRPKDLYSMVESMMYTIDELYRKEKNIEDEHKITPYLYMDSKETWDQMKNLLQEEFERYLNQNNDK